MKKLFRFVTVLIMAVILSSVAFAAATPGLNLLTGTTEVQTFDDLTSLPTFISNAELTESPFAGESGKVLHGTADSTYSTIGFGFQPALDCNRPYRIAFKIYKKADEGYGTSSTQLWIMKNGAAGWQIAKNIGNLQPNSAKGWYEYDYTVATFNTLINSNTNELDTSDISKIYIEWKYDSSSTALTNENVYVDDVSIIPAYKITYIDEDGSEIKTDYQILTAKTFSPDLLPTDKEKGIIGWSVKDDGTADAEIELKNQDFNLYAIYDNNLRLNLAADKTLLTASRDKATLTTDLWHRNGVDGISVSYSVAEGSSFVVLNDKGDGTATVSAKAEGLAKIVCTASTGEKEEMYILVDYMTLAAEEQVTMVPTISASNWLYDHTGATYNETEGAWEVIKRTDVVKSDDGNGNIVYYNNGFLNKTVNADTSTYKYVLFKLKADRATNFQIAITLNGAWKYTYPSASATNGEYVTVCADINALASGGTAGSLVIGVTNHHEKIYIKDITLSNIPTYEPEIPEVKTVKVLEKVSEISEDMGTASVKAAAFSNKSSNVKIAWKSDSDCIVVKNDGYGNATLKAMSDGTATITAYVEGDETVSESFTVEVSGQREKQSVYDIRIFFWGASTTKHSPSPSIGWYNDWGMAASAEENDYVHKLVSYLEEEFYPSKVSFEVIAASTWDNALTSETDATKDWTTHSQYVEIETLIKDFRPNIIVTAMTGNMGSATPVDVAYNAYKQMYDMMFSYCPDAIVVAQHCGLSCVSRNDQMYELLDNLYSDKVFYDYHVNPTMKLDPANLAPEYAEIHSGVAAHWGDKGHDLVATTCFNLIAPEVPANIEAEYIYLPEDIEITGDTKVDEKGASLQLGIKATPNDASADVIWSIDNSNIALISKNGLLTPLSNGTVTVTATSAFDDSVYDTHTVVITNQLDNFTLTYAAGTTDTVTGLPTADEYAAGNYTLSSVIPLRDAYTFIGWGLTENAEEAVTVVDMKKPTTVYALWKKTEGFEFEGTYDENNGFIYGFTIESGFHNNVKDSNLYTTCTAGAKVTFKSPVIDITANTLSFGLTSNYTDSTATVELTVKSGDVSKKYVYPLTSKAFTTYVADISDIKSAVTGVEIFVNAVPADSSMFDIGLDFIRFSPVKVLDKSATEFVVTDGDVYVSSLDFANSFAIGFANAKAVTEVLNFVTLNSGASFEVKGCDTVYAKADAADKNISVNSLSYNGTQYYSASATKVYTSNESGISENELLSNALTSYDIASLRVKDPQGIRAKASVSKEFSNNESVEAYGFAVAKESSILEGTISDVVINVDYTSSKKIVYGDAFNRINGTHKVYSEDDTTEFFTVVVKNVPMRKDALTANLVFRPFIKLSDGSYVYGSKITRSIHEVALTIYWLGNHDEETAAYLKQILDICGYGENMDKEIGIPVDGLYK